MDSSQSAAAQPPQGGQVAPWRWSCPACRVALVAAADGARCAACGLSFPQIDGIWRCLLPDDTSRFAAFAREYATIRASEGWQHDDDAYFRALPHVPPDDPLAALWQRRARSYALLLDRAIVPRERPPARPLAILDLGAGNCWLAHRLATRGHRVAAIDLIISDWDGLGAHRRYDTAAITPIQATFDRLPLADAVADLAIFDATLHYSANYAATLAAALRALRPDGQIVILDSPLYRDPRSGARMVSERAQTYRQRHGFPSDILGGLGYLTPALLAELATRLGLRWRVLHATSPLRRTLRHTIDRLRHGRETAAMPLIIGHRANETP